MNVFIVDDAHQMSHTLIKGGCMKFGMHLSHPILSGDEGLQSLCVGVDGWKLGGSWSCIFD